MRTDYDIAIIGGGASGLAAAVSAARSATLSGARGVKIAVLEKLDRVGKKLLATGNGRCNLANAAITPERYSGSQPAILAGMLSRAPAGRSLDFFASLGLLLETDASGRVYPYTNQASTVLDVLRREAARLGVETVCSFDARSIVKAGGGFEISAASGARAFAKAVIIAAGGCAAPQFGSDGGGFKLAKSLGHSVTPLSPCLVALKCELDNKSLKGIRAACALALFEGGRELCRDEGEAQFTEYGVSGIPAMQLSRFYSQKNCKDAELRIDFLPRLSLDETSQMLKERAKEGGEAGELLLGALNKRISALLLKRAGVEPSSAAEKLSKEELDAIARRIKGLALRITGTLPWANAQVTRGGVPLDEIDPASCESLACPSLYLAGELLDCAGECGGYNLHWAWSTGLAAGEAAFKGL